MNEKSMHLYGRLLITGEVKTLTGLRIGGSAGAFAIGGVDLPVIRNVLSQRPYIPGSSLKGKMRSLAEKATGAPLNRRIDRVSIHTAGGNGESDFKDKETYQRVGAQQYRDFWVNPLFGVPSEIGFEISGPTRLVVRDIPLTKESAAALDAARTELPFTEIKTEVAIDRITSAATPRQVERVPAGARFGPLELVLNFFIPEDVAHVGHLLTCLQLVEDDYVGGHGGRGSGKVAFEDLRVTWRSSAAYTKREDYSSDFKTLADLVTKQQELTQWVADRLQTGGQ